MSGSAQSFTGPIAKFQRRDTVDGVDLISELPDEVLGDILSRIPIKNAVGTCILSKGWKSKWKFIYNVNLSARDDDCDGDSDDGDIQTWSSTEIFAEFVDNILLQLENIRNFHLECYPCQEIDRFRVTTWLADALKYQLESFEIAFGLDLPRRNFRCKVKRVELMMYCGQAMESTPEDPSVHRILVNCNELKNFKVFMSCRIKIPLGLGDCFAKLTSLYLKEVSIEHSADMLTCIFPVLKEFVLVLCKWLRVRSIEIKAPSLTTFKYKAPGHDEADRVDNFSIKVFEAKLAYFKAFGGYIENITLIDTLANCATMKCASSNEEQGLRVQSLLMSLQTLESLTLYGYSWDANGRLPLPMFHKLEKFYCISPCSVEGLLGLLDAMPFLKFLFINMVKCFDSYDYDQVESVPSCIISHVEEVVFDYSDGMIPEFLFEKFLLKHGERLKEVLVHSSHDIYEVMEQLSEFPRASPSAEFDITYPCKSEWA